MNIQFYIEKLFASEKFAEFKKENPDAFPCGGFFAIDKSGKDNKFHFDYYIASLGKMFSFQLENGVEKIPVDEMNLNGKVPEKIGLNYSFDFDDVESLVKERMQNEGIDKKIEKILLSLQGKDGKDFLVGTIFISKMGLLKVTIDITEMKITEFEKKSFFDMIGVMRKK